MVEKATKEKVMYVIITCITTFAIMLAMVLLACIEKDDVKKFEEMKSTINSVESKTRDILKEKCVTLIEETENIKVKEALIHANFYRGDEILEIIILSQEEKLYEYRIDATDIGHGDFITTLMGGSDTYYIYGVIQKADVIFHDSKISIEYTKVKESEYKKSESEYEDISESSLAARTLYERSINLLEKEGFEIEKSFMTIEDDMICIKALIMSDTFDLPPLLEINNFYIKVPEYTSEKDIIDDILNDGKEIQETMGRVKLTYGAYRIQIDI